MKPELITRLMSRMTYKDSFIRQSPGSEIEHQMLQAYIQRGISKMLEIFGKDYLVTLKAYNQLESLINFFSKEAEKQIFKPDEPLVSSHVLMMQLNQVFISATHTNRSTGQYSKVLVYIEEKNK